MPLRPSPSPYILYLLITLNISKPSPSVWGNHAGSASCSAAILSSLTLNSLHLAICTCIACVIIGQGCSITRFCKNPKARKETPDRFSRSEAQDYW
jgi:hypothetical protein